MVQGYSSQDCSGPRSRWSGRFEREGSGYSSSTFLPIFGGDSYFGGYPYEQWHSDHEFIPTEKYDTKYSYKKERGYFPGIATIGEMLVAVENCDGNTNIKAQIVRR